MDFPAIPAIPINPPDGLLAALGLSEGKVCSSAEDLMVVMEREGDVRDVQPDYSALEQIECRGVIITSRGNQCDFVSRFFAPKVRDTRRSGNRFCTLCIDPLLGK